jgi:hypothetical protein
MEKEEYHVYCDKDGPEIDVEETKFWKKKIRKSFLFLGVANRVSCFGIVSSSVGISKFKI